MLIQSIPATIHPSAGTFDILPVSLPYDDGAVIYLNGVELARPNMPPGSIGYRTTAASGIEDTHASASYSAAGLLVEGTNVLAVEAHQISASSSDLHFALEVKAVRETPVAEPEPQGLWRSTYYDPAGLRLAVREGKTSGAQGVYLLLGDHLGSTSLVVNPDGSLHSKQLYKPWGQSRYTSPTALPTDYRYTGQRQEAELGLYYYGARWYDPAIGHFIQADTIVPGAGSPQAWDRYAYTLNNPVKYIDPSGHYSCEGSSECTFNNYHRLSGKQLLTSAISEKFGIEMVDGDMNWSSTNLRTAYHTLNEINDKLNGNLISMVQGTTFTMASQLKCGESDCYHGITTGTGVTYYVSAFSVRIPTINFFHETGHLLDSVPITRDVFSDPLNASKGGVTPMWVGKDGYVSSDILGKMFKEPVQAIPMNEPYDPNEYWADAFGNYMAGNINLSKPGGWSMYGYVYTALYPYANP